MEFFILSTHKVLFHRNKILGGGMAKRTLGGLGTLVKEARGSRELREVAAERGIRTPTLVRVENGRTPDIATLAKIGMWLNTDPRELMGMDISKDEKGSNQ